MNLRRAFRFFVGPAVLTSAFTLSGGAGGVAAQTRAPASEKTTTSQTSTQQNQTARGGSDNDNTPPRPLISIATEYAQHNKKQMVLFIEEGTGDQGELTAPVLSKRITDILRDKYGISNVKVFLGKSPDEVTDIWFMVDDKIWGSSVAGLKTEARAAVYYYRAHYPDQVNFATVSANTPGPSQ